MSRMFAPALQVCIAGLLLHGANAHGLAYRGVAEAGQYQSVLQLSPVHEDSALQARIGSQAPALFKRLPAPDALNEAQGELRWRLSFAGESGALSAAFEIGDGDKRADDKTALDGHLLPTGDPLNVVRLRAPGLDTSLRLTALRLSAGGRERVIDLSTIDQDGGLTLVDEALGQGFELSGTFLHRSDTVLRKSRPWIIEAGHATVVHIVESGPAGEVAAPDASVLCARDCRSKAAFAASSSNLTLMALRPETPALDFLGWGNDCQGIRTATTLSLRPDRSSYYCSALFAEPGSTRFPPSFKQLISKGGNPPTVVENLTPFTIPDVGAASNYPSTLGVSALGGLVNSVNVGIVGLSHTFPDDLDILLEGPTDDETSTVLMSDVCGDTNIVAVELTFTDAGKGNTLPDSDPCVTGTYHPTNFGAGDVFPPSALLPPEPYSTTLAAAFNGINPIGAWSLFVADDLPMDSGDVQGGWSIALQLGPYDILIPGSGSSGVANPYPAIQNIQGLHGEILDVDLRLFGMTHNRPEDLELLLVSPSGTKVMVMAHACGGDDITSFQWTFDDEAAQPMTDDTPSGCLPFEVRPSAFGTIQSLPDPAPPMPYDFELLKFDGEDPNGAWSLYVHDDGLFVGGGFLTTGWSLAITTTGIFADGFEDL